MASGYYPLEVGFDRGADELAAIADKLRHLLKTRGEYGALPGAWENDQTDNAASDGINEAYLFLALELIERCIKRPEATPPSQQIPTPSSNT